MDEFAKRAFNQFENEGGDIYTSVEYRLPNGHRHGVQQYSCSHINIGDEHTLYHNGIHLAKWFFWEWSTGMNCTIEYYICNCTEGFSNSYKTDRINLNGFQLESTANVEHICEKCKTGMVKREEWLNKNHECRNRGLMDVYDEIE